MRILYVAAGGFGDVSWTTSWPRLFSKMGHDLEIFFLKYTGNPFHANPYVKKLYDVQYGGINPIEYQSKIIGVLQEVLENNLYDFVLIPANQGLSGILEIRKMTEKFKNVFVGHCKVLGLDVPPYSKPEWYFTEKEQDYVKKLKYDNSILIYPLSSAYYDSSKNISFELIKECSHYIKDIVVVHGGYKYLPIEDLKRFEDMGIRVFWEDYNCFDDENGTVLGKILALESQCLVSAHGFSGSMCIAMGYSKPYVVSVPGTPINGKSAQEKLDMQSTHQSVILNHENLGIWCITEKVEDFVSAINRAKNDGK